jgi:hypothetical protein
MKENVGQNVVNEVVRFCVAMGLDSTDPPLKYLTNSRYKQPSVD